jgi:Uma2 family endonuclease
MAKVQIELPPQRTLTPLNIRRWNQLITDPILANVEGRIETNRHGQIILTSPESALHGALECEIGIRLRSLMPSGRVSVVCPISTSDGVKVADVVWASPQCLGHLGNQSLYPVCPEICVEVLSPSNSKAEIEEKKTLYFDAGAKEVWVCSKAGVMTFFDRAGAIAQSKLCPDFPKRIALAS